jgi:hypothetical protein
MRLHKGISVMVLAGLVAGGGSARAAKLSCSLSNGNPAFTINTETGEFSSGYFRVPDATVKVKTTDLSYEFQFPIRESESQFYLVVIDRGTGKFTVSPGASIGTCQVVTAPKL